MPNESVTRVVQPEQSPSRTCPNCGAVWSQQQLAEADYRCGDCGLELAYLETTPTGATRGVLGWLRRPGDVVMDRYKVEKVLGKGGFAATYLVEDLRLNGKKRALKEIPELLYDETETEMLSHLSHPSIPDITDRDRNAGMVYLVLEFGGGRTLENERRKRGGRVPVDTLLPWFRQLGEVIAYLHSQNPPIIHRDLKPENVLLDEHNRIMLIDFGIAKQSAEVGKTRTVARAATHGYSPPEQALGTGTDPRSDVYALAATAYALLTGRVPPPSHERVAGKELVPPVELVPDIPPEFNDILVQALNLNINLRPASVAELLLPIASPETPTGAITVNTSHTVRVGDLPADYTEKAASVRIRSERVSVAPTTVHPKRSRSGLWAVTGLLLAAAAGAGLWVFKDRILGDDTPATAEKTPAATEQPATPERTAATAAGEKAADSPAAASAPATQLPPGAKLPPGVTAEQLQAGMKAGTSTAAPAQTAAPPAAATAAVATPAATRPAKLTMQRPQAVVQPESPESAALSAFERRRLEAPPAAMVSEPDPQTTTSAQAATTKTATVTSSVTTSSVSGASKTGTTSSNKTKPSKTVSVSPPPKRTTPSKTSPKTAKTTTKRSSNRSSGGWTATYLGATRK